MSNVPLPRPGPLGLIQYAGIDMLQYAGEVSAADNAALRDERDNMAGAIAQLLRDNRDVHEKVVRPLRERVRVLEDALLQVAGMAEALKKDCGMDPESPQAVRNGQYMNISYAARAALAARKGEA